MNETQELRKHTTQLNYQSDLEKITQFLLFYSESEQPKYLSQLRATADEIQIFLEDVVLFDETGLASRIEQNALTYLNLFYKAIDSIIFDSSDVFLDEKEEDVFFYHRIARLKEKHPNLSVTQVLPPALLRNYAVNLIPRFNYSKAIRDMKSCDIGHLLKIRGIVTKITQIKPGASVITYVCEVCASETYQKISGDAFDCLEECQSEKCKLRNLKGTLHLQTRGSKFVKTQVLKVQELTSDVPNGSVPRSINIECYGPLTDKCLPGEFIEIGGIFLPRPYYGFRKLKAGLLTDTYFYATSIRKPSININESEIKVNPNPDINLLVRSIAPEIYGMDDVKKILLLMLVGAPTKLRNDGMRIRGDINVLLLGDPGIAKSQLLKTVCRISKRGVYTTGKGTSGVGLTANVAKDPITNEIILEGGALVLSDSGICCIDELDKMNENDRTSIHEVMEQQSVSISKAGINTTLNARCAVLGAANPVKGKYNIRKSVEANVGLPCALLSRFDVLVVLRDEPDLDKDLQLANYITSLHITDTENAELYNYDTLRTIIEECKKIDPTIPSELSKKLIDSYVEARSENLMITPRYLLSLIRLSLAHARLRMSELVRDEDVNEAIRLMKLSKISVMRIKQDRVNPKHQIYNQIIGMKREELRDGVEVTYVIRNEIFREIGSKFKTVDIEETIKEFVNLGVFVDDGETLWIYE